MADIHDHKGPGFKWQLGRALAAQLGLDEASGELVEVWFDDCGLKVRTLTASTLSYACDEATVEAEPVEDVAERLANIIRPKSPTLTALDRHVDNLVLGPKMR